MPAQSLTPPADSLLARCCELCSCYCALRSRLRSPSQRDGRLSGAGARCARRRTGAPPGTSAAAPHWACAVGRSAKGAVCAAVYQAGRRLAQGLGLDSGFRLWHWLLNEDRLSARDLKTGARLVYSDARPDIQALRLGFEALNNHVKDKSVLFAFCGTSIIEKHTTCPCAHDLCARDW